MLFLIGQPERKKLNFATLVLDILRNVIIGHEVCGKPERLRLYYVIVRETETRLIITRSRNPQLLSRLSFNPITKPFFYFLFFYLTEVIEGDILVTEPLRNVLKAGKSRAKRDIVSDMVKRWPDGVVPYKLDSSLSKCLLSVCYLE